MPGSPPYPLYTVTVMGGSPGVFWLDKGNGTYERIEGDGTLVDNGGVLTYTALNGSVAVLGGGGTYNPFIATKGLISTLTRPDGTPSFCSSHRPSTSLAPSAPPQFAKRLRGYWRGILSRVRWPMHTGQLEGVSNKIKVIKRMAYGYRDSDYFFLKIKAAFPGDR